MKQIIKVGTKKVKKYKCTCNQCGCEFICDRNDFCEMGFNYATLTAIIEVSCPCCINYIKYEDTSELEVDVSILDADDYNREQKH